MSSLLRSVVNTVLGPLDSDGRAQGHATAEELLETAEQRSRLHDWGNRQFRDGLEALLDSLSEIEDLTRLGALTFRKMIGQALVNRLRFVAEAANRPRLIAPVIITGLPRSGTTVLHRLLAVDPAFHAPPLWELLDPFANPRLDFRRWRTEAQIAFKNRLLPDLDRKHFTRADTPEECTLLLANSLASSLFWDLAPLEGYLEWVQAADQRPVYEDYRRQLEALQARRPDRRLLLKAPAHLGNLAVLHEIIPEARLIQTHRDPTACYFSHCSLRETLASFVLRVPPRQLIADQVRRVFEHDLRASLEFHEDHPGETAHVACSALQREPVHALRQARVGLDLGWSRAIEDRTECYLNRHPRGGHGRHRYSDIDWGFSKAAVSRLFIAYRERFSSDLET